MFEQPSMNPNYETYEHIRFTLLTSFQSTCLFSSVLAYFMWLLYSCAGQPCCDYPHSRVFTEWPENPGSSQ